MWRSNCQPVQLMRGQIKHNLLTVTPEERASSSGVGHPPAADPQLNLRRPAAICAGRRRTQRAARRGFLVDDAERRTTCLQTGRDREVAAIGR